MQIRQVVFPEAHSATLAHRDLDENQLEANDILVESIISLISQGTEGASFQGLVMPTGGEQRYPQEPGYANVARVVAVGDDAPFKVGDRVFSMTRHVSHAIIDTSSALVTKIPEGLDAHLAVFARLAMVSMSTLRTSTARLGDGAAVVGLGLVGNLAAQLCQIAGLRTVGIDLIPWRCELATQCGVKSVLLAPSDDQLLPVHQLVIEATGSAGGAMTGIKLTQRHGELSLVGSQWGTGTQTADTLRLLGTIFEHYIHIRSGWEWQLPILATTFGPSSLEHNARSILGWIDDGRLVVEPMLTHRVSPDDAQNAYAQMVTNKDTYLGVIFEWSN
jgi:2-desacetyl-2-hydroxyethyl bacteriochlorophyllide A dehydrogenase